ncbi:MAG: transcriptional repressor [Candidatus Hydrogenedentota bacterium]
MLRDTSQRRAIRQTFLDAGRPLSPQEVLDASKDAVPNMGIATVYRNVKNLTEEGWLVPVELPGEPPRYEVSGKEHHHHFSCRVCGGVYELEGCPGNLSKIVPTGYKLERHELVLYGLCNSCNGRK